MRRDYNREFIGTKDGTQPRGRVEKPKPQPIISVAANATPEPPKEYKPLTEKQYDEYREECKQTITQSEAAQIMAHQNGEFNGVKLYNGYVSTSHSRAINKALRENKPLSADDKQTVATLRKAISPKRRHFGLA